jgi:4-hydroxy-3-polyprenylbenzoate decarboxylase
MRDALEFMTKDEEVITIPGEIDPIYEIAALLKADDNGPALVFENVKGYPGVKVVGNMYSRRERVAKLFGLDDPKKLKFKFWQGMKKPIGPKELKEAPCQAIVITKDIDLMGTLPVFKYTPLDGARVFGGGVICVTGEYADGGSEISFKRMHFRGKDWSTMLTGGGTHIGEILTAHRGKKVPLTVNIGVPPAVTIAAAGGGLHAIIPKGSDELGMAGAFQDAPVELIKAKTVNAYSIANAEWVLEGYIDTTERVWETEEAEKGGQLHKAPFFPEWPGYLGRALHTSKFQVTAITHRRNPLFNSFLAHSIEHDVISAVVREACLYELSNRLNPGMVADVNILPCLASFAMVIIQVRKRGRGDEGFQRNIINACLGANPGLRLVVVVDEDVDIYSADDVLWAITTRVDPSSDIIIGGGGKLIGLMPVERFDAFGAPQLKPALMAGGIGFDATVPFDARWGMQRAHYPVDRVNVSKWLTPEQQAKIKAVQSDYAKILAKNGW